jgi:diguanylate cyclase (GGDEF)-like protein
MKILVVDDDVGSRRRLQSVLEELGHEVRVVEGGQEAWTLLEQSPFQVVITDWMMPGLDGLDLIRRIRGADGARYTYVFLVSALTGKGTYLQGMDAGADDFVSKPVDREELQARLRVAERILGLQDALRLEAIRDPLTGLFNRRYLEESLEREVRRATRRGTPVSVVMVDLDHFKAFNDDFGHLAGDALLQALGHLLRTRVRGEDIPCRYGGEEFALILPDAPLDATRRRAEQLREEAQHLRVDHRGEPIGPVTLSMGVATFPLHGATGEAVLRAADDALYRAKRNGRNQVIVAP